MGRVTNDEFVTQLTALLASSATAHSVYITKKRYTRGADGLGDTIMASGSDEAAETAASQQYPILIRASDGREDKSKRQKFSTLVAPADLSAFEALYLPAIRTALSASLRKRDKAKERKVDRLVSAARRKIEEQGGKVPLTGVGSKRGAGHRKRQRTAKRAAKARRDKAVHASKEGSTGAVASTSAATQVSSPPPQATAPAAAPTKSGGQAKGGKGKGK